MPRIIKSRLSREDYLEIWLYIARDNPTAADRLIQQLTGISTRWLVLR